MFIKRFLQNCSLIVLALLSCVSADCTISIRDESPLFIKKFGNKELRFKKTSGSIKLVRDENIEAHCSSTLSIQHNNRKTDIPFGVSIQCDSRNNIQYGDLGSNIYNKNVGMDHTTVSCLESRNSLYVSNTTLPNCQAYVSYGIGLILPGKADAITAGVCYDLETLTLKYATYVAYPPKYRSREQDLGLQSVELTDKVNNLDSYFSYMSKNSFDMLIAEKKATNQLLNVFEFDYASVLQDKPLSADLSRFENLFNIIWWRNLRMGNWKLFLDALEGHNKISRYLVYTGTSGVVTVPAPICSESEELAVNNNKMPKYVWSYLVSNKTESFVVIGVNSPYSYSNERRGLCKDMCNRISWLSNTLFARARLIPALGLVVCCRPEEVQNKLDHFPHVDRSHNSPVEPENYVDYEE